MTLPLRYLLDENVRGPLWNAIRVHNLVSDLPLDVVRVGDVPDLPLGSDDSSVLRWAASENRIVVSADRRTLQTHLESHLAAGLHSPGVFLMRPSYQVAAVVEWLVLMSYASEQSEWENSVYFLM